MTDYSDITQYQKDTITQILLSQVQYEFLPPSAQTLAHRQEETHTHYQAVAVSAKGTTGAHVLGQLGLKVF